MKLLLALIIFSLSAGMAYAGECLTTDEELYKDVVAFSEAAKKGAAGAGEYVWGLHCWRGDKRYESKLKKLLRNMILDSRIHPAYVAMAIRDYSLLHRNSQTLMDEMKKKQGEYRYTLVMGLVEEKYAADLNALISKAAASFSDDIDFIDGPANIYNKPNGKIKATLPDNTKIRILQQKGEWVQIAGEHVTGWLNQNNLMGKNINHIDAVGFTPISRAVFMGYLETVLFLQQKGTDNNLDDSFGRNALHWAVMGGFTHLGGIELEILNKIVTAKEIDINKADNDGFTPLLLAIREGRSDIVNVLLKKENIDVNLADKEGITPLILAVKNNNVETIRALLSTQTIRVDDIDEQGRTALYHAIIYKNQAVVRLLLDRSARTDVVTTDGKTVLHALFQPLPYRLSPDPVNIEIVKMLLACRYIDINKEDNGGDTALSLAIKNNENNALKLLLTVKEIDVNKKTPNGSSYLDSLLHKDILMSWLLLDREDIDVNVPDYRGSTAVHMGWYNVGMVKYGIETARKILDRNPNLEIENDYGWTPLVYNIT